MRVSAQFSGWIKFRSPDMCMVYTHKGRASERERGWEWSANWERKERRKNLCVLYLTFRINCSARRRQLFDSVLMKGNCSLLNRTPARTLSRTLELSDSFIYTHFYIIILKLKSHYNWMKAIERERDPILLLLFFFVVIIVVAVHIIVFNFIKSHLKSSA